MEKGPICIVNNPLIAICLSFAVIDARQYLFISSYIEKVWSFILSPSLMIINSLIKPRKTNTEMVSENPSYETSMCLGSL